MHESAEVVGVEGEKWLANKEVGSLEWCELHEFVVYILWNYLSYVQASWDFQ